MAIIGVVSVWAAVVAGVVVTLLAAELAVRFLAPRVADLLVWRDWECQHKVDAIDRLARQGGASVVTIGASPMNSAFDPHLCTNLLGLSRPAFNAALNAATIRSLELWTLGVVLPRLRPDLLVLALNSSELSDKSLVGERWLRLFQMSMGWRRLRQDPSPTQRALLKLETWSFLVRYRHFFREPGSWGRNVSLTVRYRRLKNDPRFHFRKTRGARARVSDLGMLHALSKFRDPPYKLSDTVIKTWKEIIENYHVGGHELAALHRLVDGTRATGTSVLIVLMPVTQDWIDLHGDGQRDFDRFRRVLDSYIAESGVPFVDMMRELTSWDEYADAVHRNLAGQRHFTEVLSRHVADRLGSHRR